MLMTETRNLHVRFDGRSEDLDLTVLKLSPHTDDATLLTALARHYDRQPADLDGYVVVREPQAIIVRPEAFYG